MRLFILSFTLFISSLAMAGEAPSTENQSAVSSAQQMAGIDSVTPLPITALVMIESGGKQMFVSPGGRFVFTGTLRDMWSGNTIKTVADAKDMTKIPMKKITSIKDDLGVFEYGDGKDIYVFVDPNCSYCKQLFEYSKADKEHRYNFLITPFLGKASQQDAVKLWCATDREKAGLALMGASGMDQLQQTVDCDKQPIVRNLTLAKLLGVQGVPFIVRADGQTSKGLPPNLEKWLSGE